MNGVDLTGVVLAKGSHEPDTGHGCLLEWASAAAGEEWSDTPDCVSSVLGAYGRNLNDALPTDKRQMLLPYITLIGTVDDGHDQWRADEARRWLIRVYTPAWLRLAGLTKEAAALAGLPLVTDEDWAAARAAARDAASAAARDATEAASAAAWDASAAAREAASAAAWEAAARDAASAAAWEAAARDAAWAALAPTVDVLQDSAIAFFDTLITGPVTA